MIAPWGRPRESAPANTAGIGIGNVAFDRSAYDVALARAKQWQPDAKLLKVALSDPRGVWDFTFVSLKVKNEGFKVTTAAAALSIDARSTSTVYATRTIPYNSTTTETLATTTTGTPETYNTSTVAPLIPSSTADNGTPETYTTSTDTSVPPPGDTGQTVVSAEEIPVFGVGETLPLNITSPDQAIAAARLTPGYADAIVTSVELIYNDVAHEWYWGVKTSNGITLTIEATLTP